MNNKNWAPPEWTPEFADWVSTRFLELFPSLPIVFHTEDMPRCVTQDRPHNETTPLWWVPVYNSAYCNSCIRRPSMLGYKNTLKEHWIRFYYLNKLDALKTKYSLEL